MRKSFFLLTLLIGFSALIINSCSKKSDPAPVPPPPSPVEGTWTRSNGFVVFVLTFNKNYLYSLTSSGNPLESGSYTIAAPAITFNADTGTVSKCAGKPGVYNYAIATQGTATTLTFTLGSDSCSTRSGAAVGTWYKQ